MTEQQFRDYTNELIETNTNIIKEKLEKAIKWCEPSCFETDSVSTYMAECILSAIYNNMAKSKMIIAQQLWENIRKNM